MTIQANDLEMFATARCKAEDSSKFSALVPAESFAGAIQSLPEESMAVLSYDKDKHQTVITSGKISFALVGLDVADFPAPPKIPVGVSVKAEEFALAIDRSAYAASVADKVGHLEGVLFEAHEDHTKLVALDGYRLALSQLNTTIHSDSFLVRRQPLLKIRKLLRDAMQISLAADDKHFYVSSERFEIAVRVINGEYPAYARIIPEPTDSVTVLKEDLEAALERATVITKITNKTVTFDVSEYQIAIDKVSANLGTVSDLIDATLTGKPFCFKCNIGFLADALANIETREVTLCFTKNRPLIVLPSPPEDFQAVIQLCKEEGT